MYKLLDFDPTSDFQKRANLPVKQENDWWPEFEFRCIKTHIAITPKLY